MPMIDRNRGKSNEKMLTKEGWCWQVNDERAAFNSCSGDLNDFPFALRGCWVSCWDNSLFFTCVLSNRCLDVESLSLLFPFSCHQHFVILTNDSYHSADSSDTNCMRLWIPFTCSKRPETDDWRIRIRGRIYSWFLVTRLVNNSKPSLAFFLSKLWSMMWSPSLSMQCWDQLKSLLNHGK